MMLLAIAILLPLKLNLNEFLVRRRKKTATHHTICSASTEGSILAVVLRIDYLKGDRSLPTSAFRQGKSRRAALAGVCPLS